MGVSLILTHPTGLAQHMVPENPLKAPLDNQVECVCCMSRPDGELLWSMGAGYIAVGLSGTIILARI